MKHKTFVVGLLGLLVYTRRMSNLSTCLHSLTNDEASERRKYPKDDTFQFNHLSTESSHLLPFCSVWSLGNRAMSRSSYFNSDGSVFLLMMLAFQFVLFATSPSAMPVTSISRFHAHFCVEFTCALHFASFCLF